MTNPKTKWIAVEPGVIELPTTKFRITYAPESGIPFRVTWNGKRIPGGEQGTLEIAMDVAERHMAELTIMGFEV